MKAQKDEQRQKDHFRRSFPMWKKLLMKISLRADIKYIFVAVVIKRNWKKLLFSFRGEVFHISARAGN